MILESNLLLIFGLALSRNEFLHSLSLPGAFLLASKNQMIPEALSFQDAAQLIQMGCPAEFLDVVKKTGRFLYRGEASSSICYRLQPEPDLLSAGTYPDSDAVIYFQELEDCLLAMDFSRRSNNGSRFVVHPSIAHIATSSLEDAALWGNPVSVWPLGRALSYAFPRRRKHFFEASAYSSSGYIYQWDSSSCDEDICLNKDLTQALLSSREVMFATLDNFGRESSAFVVVPARYDCNLCRSLGMI